MLRDMFVRRKAILQLAFALIAIIIVIINANKLLIAYHVNRCEWPASDEPMNATKVMFLSDLHLRVDNMDTIFDNKYHEWKIPQYVFILGDVFDSGNTVSDTQFTALVNKFHQQFPTQKSGSNTDSMPIVYIINGNHDIGFHPFMTSNSKSRFDRTFHTSSAKLIQINGINFVTINSVTMEGDFCQLCSQAVQQLHTIGQQLSQNRVDKSGPIVLTHYPLYRKDESLCGYDLDSIPEDQKYTPNRPKWDCLSANATQFILKTLRPRLIVNGHTHYGCVIQHTDSLYEWTVGSFNCRNTLNPSVLLATISSDKYSINNNMIVQLCAHTVMARYSGTYRTLAVRFGLQLPVRVIGRACMRCIVLAGTVLDCTNE
ncbi:unnamed protein product [Medioppia subpectinata]|uniref:Calcineurin-like phosphoesterase domain-containing protein n=1 Tax=Medioppia subpectinata TaxID=1979941 RepID=A0A7R9KNA6_9ACAR|nr:unnamed protein product [Medioppia subpectinata]CAG2106405.1 unnamed protein product [Medioppia subpectinata]